MAGELGASLTVMTVIPELQATELSPVDQIRIKAAFETEAAKSLLKAEKIPKKKSIPTKTLIGED